MKSFALAVISFAVLAAVSVCSCDVTVWTNSRIFHFQCKTDSAALKKTMADVRQCIKTNKFDSGVAYKLFTLDFDEPSNDLKCLIKCLGETNGAFSADGDLIKENMFKLVTSFNPELTSEVSGGKKPLESRKFKLIYLQASEIWDSCVSTVPKVDDLCEYSFQLVECGYELLRWGLLQPCRRQRLIQG